MSRVKRTGSIANHTRRKVESQKRKCKERQKHWRKKQEMKRLRANKAAEEPRPTPKARGFLAQRFWEALHLDKALEGVGIIKTGGLAVGCILMVVLLFGVMDVTSLCALAEAVGQAYADLDQRLDEILVEVSDEEASTAPAEGEWTVLQVLAHLVMSERAIQLDTACRVNKQSLTVFPGNNEGPLDAIVASHV